MRESSLFIRHSGQLGSLRANRYPYVLRSFLVALRLPAGGRPAATYLSCFAKKGMPKKATAFRCPAGSRLCKSQNGKCRNSLRSNICTSFSIFCLAQSAAHKRNSQFKCRCNFNFNFNFNCKKIYDYMFSIYD